MYSLPVRQRDNWPVWTVDISAHPLSHQQSCCSPHTKIKADTSQLITNPIDLPGTQNPLKRNSKTNAKAVQRYFPPFSHWQSKTRLVVMFWRLQTFQTIYSRVFTVFWPVRTKICLVGNILTGQKPYGRACQHGRLLFKNHFETSCWLNISPCLNILKHSNI